MAHAALAQVPGLWSGSAGIFDKRREPRHFVGIDVNRRGVGIDGGTAPFRRAIEARKDHRIFAEAEGNELPFTARGAKLPDGPAMNFRRAIREHVFGEKLARERRGLGWE